MINNNEELVRVLKQSEKEALLLKNEFVGTEHLILGILNSKNALKDDLVNNGLTYQSCRKEIKNISTASIKTNIIIYTPLLKRLIMNIPNNTFFRCLWIFSVMALCPPFTSSPVRRP